jgi:hypothetical protein
MTDLSYAQLKGVWLKAAAGTKYDTNAWASLMAAIAEAESSGDPDAINPTDNDGKQTSWGLWQISNGTHSSVSKEWNNPLVNAGLAIQKLENPLGLGNWGTYTSGAYKAFLSDATSATLAGITAITGTSAVDAAQLDAAQQSASDCAWSLGGHGQLVPFISATKVSVSFCVLYKSQGRAIIGAGFILTGVLVLLAGVGILTSVEILEKLGVVGTAAVGAAKVVGLSGPAAGVAEAAAV